MTLTVVSDAGPVVSEKYLSVLDLRPAWHAQAACRGNGVEAFFQDHQAHAAKKICAGCPVVTECLDTSLVGFGDHLAKEHHGIWGGAGESVRREFLRLRPGRPHPEPGPIAGCGCEWCAALTRHLDRLVSGRATIRGNVAVANRNGPRARHGLRVTYNRGCRCPACMWSATKSAQALVRAGVDTGTWWTNHLGGIAVSDPLAVEAARAVASIQALVELGEIRPHSEVCRAGKRLRQVLRDTRPEGAADAA